MLRTSDMYKSRLLLCLCISLAACAQETPPPVTSQAFDLIAPQHSGVDFVNRVNESPDRHFPMYEYIYNGAGVAVGDFNNDALPDLFFTGNDAPNRLYINRGNFQFTDVSEGAGISSDRWSTGVTLVDINEDGWLDIYVSNSGPNATDTQLKNQLYINNQNLGFEEKAAQYGIDDDSRSIQATFFDMDNDGDLDLFVMNHELRNRSNKARDWFAAKSALTPAEARRGSNTLYRNNGKGKFEDISAEAGIEKTAFGLCLAVSDFDENGFLDVYVGNDYFIPDFMFLNKGDGTFTDRARQKLGHSSYYSMGCDVADFNNDGLQDLVVVDMTPADHVRNKTLMASMDSQAFNFLTGKMQFHPQYMFNSLFINRGFGSMSEIALMAGVSQTDWSWAALLADYDNDGHKDLFVSNGYRRDTKDNDWRARLSEIKREKGSAYAPADYFAHLETANSTPVPNQIFKNNGKLQFENTTAKWSMEQPSFSNGAAYADLDADGDLDIVVNNNDSPAFIYRNNSRELHKTNFISVRLKQGNNHNKVLNSKVTIYYGDQMQTQEYAFTRGYQSYVEPQVHFGLGTIKAIDSLEIKWNDALVTRIKNPELNMVHTIDREAASPIHVNSPPVSPLFADATQALLDSVFVHKENPFNDYEKQVLLPHRQSTLGPALAVGDLNGDSLEDFYIGGAQGQSGAVYFQRNNAGFQRAQIKVLAEDSGFEDLGALIFDADEDGDNDLYVAGGSDTGEAPENLQDRLYLNNGKGEFSRSTGLPRMPSTTMAVAAHDWDGDGDLDLFVGGRTRIGRYPLPPSSYLLQNNHGTFSDVTNELAPELASIGMVTDALWGDADNDGSKDLILVGEWMPITVLGRTRDGFVNQTESLGLANTTGWWYSIAQADFDFDGDEDLVAGNVGKNNKFQPSELKPLYIFADDFDGSGSTDIVLSKIYQGEKVPVRGRQCASEQMPFIADQFPTYQSFATATMDSIFGADKLQESVQYQASQFASVYLENREGGKYELRELPIESQMAPIHGVVINDFEKDGKLDIVIAGNTLNTEVETPRYDAGKGLYLKGLGADHFSTTLQMLHSGLFLYRNVKDIQIIHIGPERRPVLLVANNNTAMQLLAWTR